MNTSYIILAASIISILSFGGVLLTIKTVQSWFFKNSTFLVTFAAGVFIMTSVGLIGETFEFLSNRTAIISIVGGFLAMFVLHKILPETHQHEGVSCDSCVTKKSGTKLIIGDSIHNIADGIVLVAAFSFSLELGILTSISIAVHEFIQEISEYVVLRNSGYSMRKSLTLNFISALSIFIGVLIGLFLTQETTTQAILLGISGGAFLHVVFHDLIPYSSLSHISTKPFLKHSILFILGIGIMMVIGALAPHTHEHGHDHEHGDHHIHEEAMSEPHDHEHTHEHDHEKYNH